MSAGSCARSGKRWDPRGRRGYSFRSRMSADPAGGGILGILLRTLLVLYRRQLAPPGRAVRFRRRARLDGLWRPVSDDRGATAPRGSGRYGRPARVGGHRGAGRALPSERCDCNRDLASSPGGGCRGRQANCALGIGVKSGLLLDDPWDRWEVAAAVDINPFRQGHFMPATAHPIIGPQEAAALSPDLVIIMNPVYRDEISEVLQSHGCSSQLVTV